MVMAVSATVLNRPQGSPVMAVALRSNPTHPDPWWDGMLVVKR
jgi:hypothetical protein